MAATGLVEGKAPDNAYRITGGFHVEYKDGTEADYAISGEGESIIALDCPGELTYVTTMDTGIDLLYFYVYSEAGVTTQEFEVGSKRY